MYIDTTFGYAIAQQCLFYIHNQLSTRLHLTRIIYQFDVRLWTINATIPTAAYLPPLTTLEMSAAKQINRKHNVCWRLPHARAPMIEEKNYLIYLYKFTSYTYMPLFRICIIRFPFCVYKKKNQHTLYDIKNTRIILQVANYATQTWLQMREARAQQTNK